MSSQDVFTNLLDPLVVVYGEPKTADVGAFLREYAGVMADYSADELGHAKTTIMREHAFRSFPTPAECLKACELARKELSPIWGDKMRAQIAACSNVVTLDDVWASEISPRRKTVSKSTFEAVKMAANTRARELGKTNLSDRMTGDNSGG